MSPHPFQGGEFSVSSLLLQDTHGEQEVRRRAACVSKSDLQMLGQREGGREGEEAVEVDAGLDVLRGGKTTAELVCPG